MNKKSRILICLNCGTLHFFFDRGPAVCHECNNSNWTDINLVIYKYFQFLRDILKIVNGWGKLNES